MHVVEAGAKPQPRPFARAGGGAHPPAQLDLVDAEEHQRFHAQWLRPLDQRIDGARLRAAIAPVFRQVFRAQPEGQAIASGVCAVAFGARRRHRQRELWAQAHAQSAVGLLHPAGQEIHRRGADEAGDEARARGVIELVGGPICSIRPRFITTTRSASVIASTWSWVTYTVVVRTFWCTFLISMRICTRSLASRLESGSSNRNTLGLRTIAPPIATRWR